MKEGDGEFFGGAKLREERSGDGGGADVGEEGATVHGESRVEIESRGKSRGGESLSLGM